MAYDESNIITIAVVGPSRVFIYFFERENMSSIFKISKIVLKKM